MGLQGLHAGLGAALLDAAQGGALFRRAAGTLVAEGLVQLGREFDAQALRPGVPLSQEVGKTGATHRGLLLLWRAVRRLPSSPARALRCEPNLEPLAIVPWLPWPAQEYSSIQPRTH